MNRIAGLAGSALVAGMTGTGFAAEPAPPKGSKAAHPILLPDFNTRTPVFKAPPGSCDAHAHIFGPQARYPYSPKRHYTPPDVGLDRFRTMHEKLGIDRAVIVNPSVYDTDARVLIDAIAQSGGRYRGIVNVNDSVSDATLTALDKGGVRGCRFLFVKHLGGYPDMAMFDRTVKRIAKLGWHLDLYMDAADLPRFSPMLTALPVKYIFDHMGHVSARDGLEQKPFTDLLDLFRRDPKCHVKISGVDRVSASGAPYHDAVPFAHRLIETEPDRVLWGSDWPHPNVKVMPKDGDLVDLIPLYTADPALQKKLLVDNPARLFQFES